MPTETQKNLKILVGTLHCIENELEACLAAIQSQTYPAHDCFVISGKPNKEANDQLYQTFMDRARDVDLFIRIDADMVLCRNTFFEEVVERFTTEPDLGHLMISLYDWMTDKSIMGMHVYRCTHRWNLGAEAYFLDLQDGKHHIVADRDRLAPAAVHCGDPSPFQAFHFGLHKAVKFTQLARGNVDLSHRENHWRHFKNLDRHYQRSGDRRLGLARVGFLHALANGYDSRHVDFTCPEAHSAFERYQAMSLQQLNAKARSFGPVGWAFLPFKLRRIAANRILRSNSKTIKMPDSKSRP
jgi:hypothetical protein